VSLGSRATPIPCHHILLNEEAAPETIATLELQVDDDRMEDLLKGWLRASTERSSVMSSRNALRVVPAGGRIRRKKSELLRTKRA